MAHPQIQMNPFPAFFRTLSSFFNPQPMASDDSFDVLFSTRLQWDVEDFYTLYTGALCIGGDFQGAMDAHPVGKLFHRKIKKCLADSEHEFIQSNLFQNQATRMLLERMQVTHNPTDNDFAKFFAHPEYEQLLDALSDSQTVIPIAAPTAALVVPSLPPAVAVASVASATLPVILPVGKSLSQSSSEDRPNIPSSVLPSYSNTSRPSTFQFPLRQQITIGIADFLHLMSQTIPGRLISRSLISLPLKDGRASDRFVGADLLDTQEYHTASEVASFTPKRLKLLHLVVLAYVLHREYPLYSLFKNQCYWFAVTFFHAALIIDMTLCGRRPLDEVDVDVLDHIFLPLEPSLSADSGGTWNGLKISACKKVVLSIVIKKFFIELAECYSKVR